MTCVFCNDTGSLSKNLHGSLDCAHCDTAAERVMVEHWARKNTPCVHAVDAWLLHQHATQITAVHQ
jgi:hypothetical protein